MYNIPYPNPVHRPRIPQLQYYKVLPAALALLTALEWPELLRIQRFKV